MPGKRLGSARFEVGRLAVGKIDHPAVVSQAAQKKLAAKQPHDEVQAQPMIAA
ncbi:MAG: hypothetical protein KJO40_18020 [Deltaproteobacteria bacterium]|nr:hypothetical protein [Deltaproteobacteria bacterium]NND29039.1 hypothetical protein [Myxococcales bacterium]MBT8463954.1 hypothetical protein [Deltaproteobacteria bacterium]MBT8480068.1 hypothetical protein [Deltaproteobacteria bacterium]NNK07750.1 hypothetical protein [Myxococcales bacterium]